MNKPRVHSTQFNGRTNEMENIEMIGQLTVFERVVTESWKQEQKKNRDLL